MCAGGGDALRQALRGELNPGNWVRFSAVGEKVASQN